MLFRLINRAVRELAAHAILNDAPEGYVVVVREPTRTLEQNALLWVYLNALADQLRWPLLINGKWETDYMSDEDWKDFLTASFEGDARRMARGIDNTGLVMMGASTRQYGKKKFSEFIEFVIAFCTLHNVFVDAAPYLGEYDHDRHHPS